MGCIINNEEGLWVAKLASPLPHTSNNLVEIEALERGLLLCHKMGLSKVFIEGDSQVVINAIRQKKTPNWVLNSKLQEVLLLLDNFEDWFIIHIYREGNSMAGDLANKGVDGESFMLINSVSSTL